MLSFSNELAITPTLIPGLLLLTLPVHGDNRGWFKENWQREKMVAAGLPDFGPVQNNISFNEKRGVTRGIHAEPWDKYVSVAAGSIFGAWVDLREGKSFGTVFTAQITPGQAVFVPRGVGNAFQTLEDKTAYTYLVNDHWSESNKEYAFLNLADESAAISWPIPLEQAELSDKDQGHPRLKDVTPVKPRRILVLGANGQVGKALKSVFPEAEFVTRDTFDITSEASWRSKKWRQYSAIINAAAYTNVDAAETAEGRKQAWQTNATAVSLMAHIANEYGLILVHVSTDYVFDGTAPVHDETELPSPLGVYGQSKAAGDTAVQSVSRHYLLRTSWVIGDGPNFIATMRRLSESDTNPKVVNDQIGRLTFASDIADAIKYLMDKGAPYGIYNVSGSGKPASWYSIARKVFSLCGQDESRVTAIPTDEYFKDKPTAAARPLQSTLNLAKIEAEGFKPAQWELSLENYVKRLQEGGSS